MKKIISIISLMAVVLLMACSSENDEKFNKLNDLIKNNKVEELAKSADELYMDKAEYTAKELVQLSVAYKYLAEQEMQGRNDATYLADYISRALDCFNKAKDTDSDAVEEYLKDKESSWYTPSDNIIAVPLDPISGKVAESNKNILYYFKRGTEPITN